MKLCHASRMYEYCHFQGYSRPRNSLYFVYCPQNSVPHLTRICLTYSTHFDVTEIRGLSRQSWPNVNARCTYGSKMCKIVPIWSMLVYLSSNWRDCCFEGLRYHWKSYGYHWNLMEKMLLLRCITHHVKSLVIFGIKEETFGAVQDFGK